MENDWAVTLRFTGEKEVLEDLLDGLDSPSQQPDFVARGPATEVQDVSMYRLDLTRLMELVADVSTAFVNSMLLVQAIHYALQRQKETTLRIESPVARVEFKTAEDLTDEQIKETLGKLLDAM